MTKTYKIEVDCANCAAKMEEAVKQTEGILNATISFMTLKLKVEFKNLKLKVGNYYTLLKINHYICGTNVRQTEL